MKKPILLLFAFLVFQPLYSQQWQHVGLDSARVSKLLVDPVDDKILYAGCVWPPSKFGLFKSEDASSSWDKLLGHSVYDFELDSQNPNVIYVSSGNIFKSTDRGHTWFRSDSGLVYGGTMGNTVVLTIDPSNSKILYSSVRHSLTGGGEVYKSINGAGFWENVQGLPRETAADEIAIDPDNNENIYLGRYYTGDLYKSTNFGETWKKLDFPAEGGRITFIKFFHGNSDKLFVGTTARGGIVFSRDAGISWEIVNTGLPDNSEVWDITFIGTTPYIAVCSLHLSGIFKSSIDSIDWVPVGETDIFKDQVIYTLQYSAYYNALFAGTYNKGVFSYSFPVKVESKPGKKPHLFQLKQNYPNPFNNSTVIEYELKESAHVILKVYNVSGELITTLADNDKNAGKHKVQFSADGLPSGIYFYEIKTEFFLDTKKLLLVR